MPNVAHHLYSNFEQPEAPAFVATNCSFAGVDAAFGYEGSKSFKITSNVAAPTAAWVSLARNSADYHIAIPPRRKWVLSFYGACDAASKSLRCYIRRNSDAAYALAAGTSSGTPLTWTRPYVQLDWSAVDATAVLLRVDNVAGTGVSMWFDALMLEEVEALPATPSTYVAPDHPYSLVAQCGDMLVSESGTGRLITDGLAIREAMLPVAIKNLDGTYDYVNLRNL